MDLLGSILGSMEKPPSMSDTDKKKIKAQKDMEDKVREREKRVLEEFRKKIEEKINKFINNPKEIKLRLEPMDTRQRAVVHEVAEIAKLLSWSFGLEEKDRYVMMWKAEYPPSTEELAALRRDEEWDPAMAKQTEQLKEQEQFAANVKPDKKMQPNSNYRDKYKHLIGDVAAKDAAQSTKTNRTYGFVSSENKQDKRTIEQVLAETHAKKRSKLEHNVIESEPHDSTGNPENQS